ncbi:MAG: hypothetical protein Q7J67_02810 [bacterium]|nr:hypothetical protein [bacterium]
MGINNKIRVFDLKEDKKVSGKCLLIDIGIGNYIELVKNNLENLPIQRGKVISRKNDVYNRLKEDLKSNTIMPPLSLVASREFSDSIKDIEDTKRIEDIINDKVNEKSLSILDGLQRTYCILNVIDELKDKPEKLKHFKSSRIRAELWYSIKTNALLYKILVLNTGQFKMSMRHQLEILYIPLKEAISNIATKRGIEDMRFSTYKDSSPSKKPYQYSFANIVEALTAFNTRDPIVDKTNIVVAELERMRFIEEHSDTLKLCSDDDIEQFSNLLFNLDEKLWKKYRERMKESDDFGNEKSLEWTSRNGFMNSAPFLSGFFASCGNYRNRNNENYESRKSEFFRIFDENIEDPLKLRILSNILEDEEARSKKIGITLRNFFFHGFNEFLGGENNFEMIWQRATQG